MQSYETYTFSETISGSIIKTYHNPGDHLRIDLTPIGDGSITEFILPSYYLNYILYANYLIPGGFIESGMGNYLLLFRDIYPLIHNVDYIIDTSNGVKFILADPPNEGEIVRIIKRSIMRNWYEPIPESFYTLINNTSFRIDLSHANLERGQHKLAVEYYNTLGNIITDYFDVPFYDDYDVRADDLNEMFLSFISSFNYNIMGNGEYTFNRNSSKSIIQINRSYNGVPIINNLDISYFSRDTSERIISGYKEINSYLDKSLNIDYNLNGESILIV